MRPRRRRAQGEIVPNLAPMVDVIMVLLVFFLLGATFNLTREGMLQTELDPNSGPGLGAQVRVNPLVRIGLADVENGQAAKIFLMEEPVEGGFDALRELLERRRVAGADTQNPVVIGAETGVRWRFVVAAMDATVRAGFKNVQFAVSFKAGSLGAEK